MARSSRTPSRGKAQADAVEGKGNHAQRTGLLNRSRVLAQGESRPHVPRELTIASSNAREQTDRGRQWLELRQLAKPAKVHFCPHADISQMTLAWPLFLRGHPSSTKWGGLKPPAQCAHTLTNTTSGTKATGSASVRLRQGIQAVSGRA